jgi:hypothetical protein
MFTYPPIRELLPKVLVEEVCAEPRIQHIAEHTSLVADRIKSVSDCEVAADGVVSRHHSLRRRCCTTAEGQAVGDLAGATSAKSLAYNSR